MDACCKTRYPILLLHGAGFRDLKRPLYWGRIPGALEAHGAALYYGQQDGWGKVTENARFLKRRLLDILAETGAEKVNIIAHSKGGLEARVLASGLGMGDKIASITTVGTPHRGSRVIDRLLEAPRPLFSLAALAVNNWIRLAGDKKPDFLAVCQGFSTAAMAAFNRENPNQPQVFYQSYACVMAAPWSDINLGTANLVIQWLEGDNDGLVSVSSAQWGAVSHVLQGPGRRGISHLDEVDFRRRPFKKQGKGILDICDVYVEMVQDLKARGL